MFVRILFLLLLAANIGVGAWLYLAPKSNAALPSKTDPRVPALVLLSERDASLPEYASAEMAIAPQKLPDAADLICQSLGPFPTQADLRRGLSALTPEVLSIQFRETRQVQSRGFVVYLPAQATREQALNLARQINEKGVRDYYVVTAGDKQNTISLGLFRDQSNAQKRHAQIIKLGFDAKVQERVEQTPAYWLDYAESRKQAVNWRELITDATGLNQKSIPCF